jgi:hypothetical protein
MLASETPCHHNSLYTPFSPRDMSTISDPVLDAVAAIESAESREQPSYRVAAKRFGVDRTTLSRRYRHKARPHAGATQCNVYSTYNNR